MTRIWNHNISYPEYKMGRDKAKVRLRMNTDQLETGLRAHRAYLYLGFVCNNNCVFCASDRTNRAKDKKELTIDEVKSFVEEQSEHCDHLLISGGEPTIHRDILDIVHLAKSKFRYVHIATNGILLAEYSFACELISIGVDCVSIPVYHTCEDTFNDLVKNDIAYSSVLLALRNLHNLKSKYAFQVGIKLLIMKPNYKANPDVVTLIEDVFPEPDSLSLATLRISEKVLENLSELAVDLNVARPYVTETVRRMMKYRFMFDHVPLCALETDLLYELLEKDLLHKQPNVSNVLRPDAKLNKAFLPHYESPSCKQCAVTQYCDRVARKNFQFMNYDDQMHPVPKRAL